MLLRSCPTAKVSSRPLAGSQALAYRPSARTYGAIKRRGWRTAATERTTDDPYTIQILAVGGVPFFGPSETKFRHRYGQPVRVTFHNTQPTAYRIYLVSMEHALAYEDAKPLQILKEGQGTGIDVTWTVDLPVNPSDNTFTFGLGHIDQMPQNQDIADKVRCKISVANVDGEQIAWIRNKPLPAEQLPKDHGIGA